MRFESCSTRRRRFGSPRIGNTVDLAVSTNKNNNDDDDDVAQSIIIFQIMIGLSRKEGQSAVDGRNKCIAMLPRFMQIYFCKYQLESRSLSLRNMNLFDFFNS